MYMYMCASIETARLQAMIDDEKRDMQNTVDTVQQQGMVV